MSRRSRRSFESGDMIRELTLGGEVVTYPRVQQFDHSLLTSFLSYLGALFGFICPQVFIFTFYLIHISRFPSVWIALLCVLVCCRAVLLLREITAVKFVLVNMEAYGSVLQNYRKSEESG